jgi:hypothetical protein
MDGLSLDHEALCVTFVIFRDLTQYYVASPDPYATKARAHLRSVSRGTDAFFASLHQDLHDICTHCCQPDSWVGWDFGVRSEVHALLQCLESLIKPSEADEVQVLPQKHFKFAAILEILTSRYRIPLKSSKVSGNMLLSGSTKKP